MQEGGGDSFTSNIAPDPGHLLLLLSPGHLVSRHHRAVDNSSGGQGEGWLSVAASKGLVGIACILVRIPLTLLLIDSVVPCNLEDRGGVSSCQSLSFTLLSWTTCLRVPIQGAEPLSSSLSSCFWLLRGLSVTCLREPAQGLSSDSVSAIV